MRPRSIFMKAPAVFLIAFALAVAGCAGRPAALLSPNSPAGTDVGTSFPGVNQPTTTTTATRSDNPAPEQPNSRR